MQTESSQARPVMELELCRRGGDRRRRNNARPHQTTYMKEENYIFSGMSFCRRMSYTMGVFCHLYLQMILLMRSGDIETNPGPNTLESTVSELELLRLSESIKRSNYTELGVHLGVPYNDLCAIQESSRGNTDAFMHMFIRWRDQQPPGTNFRHVLAQKLNETELYDLQLKVLDGSLIHSRTGEPSRPMRPYIPPLSAEMVERCKLDFKFKYRTTVCKIRADPLNPDSLVQFEDMFIHLALEEVIGESRRSLEYKDLFDLKVNGEFPRRIFLQGQAGVGKTTLCAKIAWDWINERYGLGQYEWALIVHFRDAQQYSIGEIAKSYLTRNNPTTVHQLTEYIRSNPAKVFIAFDGLDEFNGKLIKRVEDIPQSQSSDQTELQSTSSNNASVQSRGSTSAVCESQSLDVDVADIILSVQLEKCPVLVTCRPWRAREITSDEGLMKLYTVVHVEGFNEEYLLQYFHKYFLKDEAKINELRALIRENDVIAEYMVQNPFHVAILCLLWKELIDQNLKELSFIQTNSQLVREIVCFLKEHYAQKKIREVASKRLTACLQEINRLLQPISKLALTGLLENKLAFSKDDFKECPNSMEISLKTGVLSQEDRPNTAIERQDESTSHLQTVVFFPQKLFQEYLAGKHLSSLYESDQNEFIRLMEQVVLPHKDEFTYLLYFTVSQNNKDVAVYVMKSLMQGDAYSIKKRDFMVDVVVESQKQEAATSVRDMLSSRKMELNVNTNMTAHTLAGYAYTLLDLVKLAVERDCGPAMSSNVGDIICSSPSLKEACLGLHSSFFQNWLFKILAEKGRNSKVQTLYLQGVVIPSPVSSHDLAEALCSMPNLTHLTLDRLDLHDEFYSTLKALASYMQVQYLCLRGINCLAAAPSHDFAVALCSMPNLSDLTMIDVGFGEEFYTTFNAIATYLKGFPRFSDREFRFNGFTQKTLDVFLQSLADYKRVHSPRRTSLLSALRGRQLTGHMRSPNQLPLLTWNRTGEDYHGPGSASSSSEQARAMHQAAMASSRASSRGYPDFDFHPDFPLRRSRPNRRDPRGFPDTSSGRHRNLPFSWYESFLASQEGPHRGARRRMDRYLAAFGAHSSLPWDPRFMPPYYPSMEDFAMSSHSWSSDFHHRSRPSRHRMAPHRHPFFDDDSDSD